MSCATSGWRNPARVLRPAWLGLGLGLGFGFGFGFGLGVLRRAALWNSAIRSSPVARGAACSKVRVRERERVRVRIRVWLVLVLVLG